MKPTVKLVIIFGIIIICLSFIVSVVFDIDTSKELPYGGVILCALLMFVGILKRIYK